MKYGENCMQFYFAPMEGITGYIYRNAYEAVFAGVDKYFAPFIVPHKNRGFKMKELKDIFPENNQQIHLVPQILTNEAEDFIRTAEEFRAMGYEEINLNLGCPSGTVTAKKKGAGFLAYPKELDVFLDEIYEKAKIKISIKTRIGVSDREEFYTLMDIYNKYPISELIVHPRLLKDFYQNSPDIETFVQATQSYSGKIIYNGDIFSKEQYQTLMEKTQHIDGVMLGRGLLYNPGLLREIQGEVLLEKDELKIFHDLILNGYIEVLSGDRNVLFRMKELWHYMIHLFQEPEKYAKKIKKTQTVEDYRYIIESLFADKRLIHE